MVGSEADQTYTTDELKSLERRLYANAAVDFDRQLGELIAALKASGSYDDTTIIVTADHGATMTERADRRVGDTLEQRWSEVAHVPLMVKSAGQADAGDRHGAEVDRADRRDGGGGDGCPAARQPRAEPGPVRGPAVGSGVHDRRGRGDDAVGVRRDIAAVDPWRPDDLTPPDPRYPFAIGIDAGLLGAPVPADWVEVPPTAVEVLPGESDQQLVIVDRAARRVRQRRHCRPRRRWTGRRRLGPVGGAGRLGRRH